MSPICLSNLRFLPANLVHRRGVLVGHDNTVKHRLYGGERIHVYKGFPKKSNEYSPAMNRAAIDCGI